MEMKICFGRNILEGKCNRLGLHCDHIDDHKKDDNPNNTQEKDTFIATQTFGNSRDLTFRLQYQLKLHSGSYANPPKDDWNVMKGKRIYTKMKWTATLKDGDCYVIHPKDEFWEEQPETETSTRFQHSVEHGSVEDDCTSVACVFRVCLESCLCQFDSKTNRVILTEKEEADLQKQATIATQNKRRKLPMSRDKYWQTFLGNRMSNFGNMNHR